MKTSHPVISISPANRLHVVAEGEPLEVRGPVDSLPDGLAPEAHTESGVLVRPQRGVHVVRSAGEPSYVAAVPRVTLDTYGAHVVAMGLHGEGLSRVEPLRAWLAEHLTERGQLVGLVLDKPTNARAAEAFAR